MTGWSGFHSAFNKILRSQFITQENVFDEDYILQDK